jgi:hypothetical protein
VTNILQSFEEHEEVFRASESLVESRDPVFLDKISTPGTASEERIARFERLAYMKSILIGAPQIVGCRRAWDIYNDVRSGGHPYVEKLYGQKLTNPPAFVDYDDFKKYHRAAVAVIRREEEKAKAPKKRKAQAENEGYTEPVVEPVIDHPRFTPDHVTKSVVEDKWKSEFYSNLCNSVNEILSPHSAAVDSDAFMHVLKRATAQYVRAESRPVLTNELADYDNPYMMKKATTERLLNQNCVRNKLEESLVSQFIDSRPDMIKLRSEAELPPEVLEPLQAFRGITNWSMNPEIRMNQKLDSINVLLSGSTPHTTPAWRWNHPYANHIGFVSQIPRGRRGGWGHGKPLSSTQQDLAQMRYPTLQRVAHSLPKDPQYRAQAIHAIQVLERSKGWQFDDKTRAINTLKEVLDNLPSARTIEGKLDKALPVVRYGGHHIRRKPSNLKRRNRIRMYFRSMTAIVPLTRRWSDRRAKNAARSKKKDSKK